MEELILLLLLLAAPVLADSPQDLYHAGNALYAEGKFGEAAQKYQASSDMGFRHWVLEYDLGNAYYRAGQIGKAVLHYERAFRMNSSQGDVVYNLNLATTKVGDPELPTTALAALGWKLFYALSINVLTVLASFCLLGLLIAAGSALAGGPLVKGPPLLGLGMLFLALAGWLGLRITSLEKPVGVVVSSVAEVRSGPSTTYAANFTVPEGRRVLILKEEEPIQGWLEIGVPQEGLKGWVPDSSIDVI